MPSRRAIPGSSTSREVSGTRKARSTSGRSPAAVGDPTGEGDRPRRPTTSPPLHSQLARDGPVQARQPRRSRGSAGPSPNDNCRSTQGASTEFTASQSTPHWIWIGSPNSRMRSGGSGRTQPDGTTDSTLVPLTTGTRESTRSRVRTIDEPSARRTGFSRSRVGDPTGIARPRRDAGRTWGPCVRPVTHGDWVGSVARSTREVAGWASGS